MNYLVICDYPAEGTLTYYPSRDKAEDAVRELIRIAEDMLGGLEGRYPTWVDDITIAEVIGEVNHVPNGLVLRRLKL